MTDEDFDLPKYAPSYDELRERLPLEFVVAHYGYPAAPGKNCPCPFHSPDEQPSFGIFVGDDGIHRWNCYPCGEHGDVIQFLRKHLNLSYVDALTQAEVLLEQLPDSYVPDATPIPERPSPDTWRDEVDSARQRATHEPGILSARVGLAPVSDPQLCARWDRYLRDTWRWGINELGSIYMPHYDQNDNLTGCKLRHGDGRKDAVHGSLYPDLYGAWASRHHSEVLLVEGESDAVYAGYTAREEQVQVDVFALPSGAQERVKTEWLKFLANARTIYLCFDPDKAGTDATWRWIRELEKYERWTIKICALPLGRDLRAAAPSIRALLDSAKELIDQPTAVWVDKGGYWKLGKMVENDEGEKVPEHLRVTNWYVEPTAQLVQGDAGYDVNITHRGNKSQGVIRLSNLTSARDLKKWATGYGLLFTGTEGDSQRIAEHITWRGSVTPEIYQTDTVGMQIAPVEYEFAGPSVVFPDGYVGKLPWRYVPSARTADVSDKVLLPAEGPLLWPWITDFLNLNKREVTEPLLAWLVASARRTEVREFPLLFIGGSSGVGKSTLARYALRLMGSKIEVDLGSITPFILLRTLASSRSLPVFVDEWTKLSRKDVREAFQGTVPVLYTGGGAERGQADLSSAVYQMTAPVLVAGEDTFALDREVERTVTILPTRDGQSLRAHYRLAEAPLERFGQLLQSWLTTQPTLPSLGSVTADRTEYNREILKGGWQTLLLLAEEAAHHDPLVPDLPDNPNLSGLDLVAEDHENVYDTALLESVSLLDSARNPIVWRDEEGRGAWIRPTQVVKAVKDLDIQLPGGSRAMKDYFEAKYGTLELGASQTPPGRMTPLRAWLIPGYDLPENDDPRSTFTFE